MTGARDITQLCFSSLLAGTVANKIEQIFYSVYSYSGIEPSIECALSIYMKSYSIWILKLTTAIPYKNITYYHYLIMVINKFSFIVISKASETNLSPGSLTGQTFSVPGAPLTNFNDGGGGGEVHILYPKKSQLQNFCLPKKITTFSSIPQKIP